MSSIVSYDVKQGHSELKQQLVARGFYFCIMLNDKTRKLLPASTVMYDSNDLNVVITQFNAALQATTPSPGLEKIVCVPIGDNVTFWIESNETC